MLIVAGKGGVGKTTVAAAMGIAASRLGIDTLLVEIEGKRGLGSLFAKPGLVYDDTVLVAADTGSGQARLRARTIRATDALLDYLDDHSQGVFAKTLAKMQVLDTLATSTPGLNDLIVLGKIRQLEQSGDAELIIVDAPASGHAISFLRSARRLQATVETGPIKRQADEVVDLLTDPSRAQVLLVTLAEETPVNELIETAYALEDEVGIQLGPAVVNAVFEPRPLSVRPSRSKHLEPALARAAAEAAAFWVSRADAQRDQVQRLAHELPLEQLVLPRRMQTDLSMEDVGELATVLHDQVANLSFGARS